MSVIDSLNKIGQCEYKYTKSVSDLEQGKPYKIVDLNIVQTRYGPCVVAVLEEMSVYLPHRFSKEINEEKITELKEKGVSLIYDGKEKINGRETNLCSFII